MNYALVLDGQIVDVRQPGRTETKIVDGRPLGAPEGRWTPELAALCGFVPIVESVRPGDTDTTTSDRSVLLVEGVPTSSWVVRSKTVEEMTPPAKSSEEKLDAARTALAVVATIEAPVLTADVLDVLTDLAAALED